MQPISVGLAVPHILISQERLKTVTAIPVKIESKRMFLVCTVVAWMMVLGHRLELNRLLWRGSTEGKLTRSLRHRVPNEYSPPVAVQVSYAERCCSQRPCISALLASAERASCLGMTGRTTFLSISSSTELISFTASVTSEIYSPWP